MYMFVNLEISGLHALGPECDLFFGNLRPRPRKQLVSFSIFLETSESAHSYCFAQSGSQKHPHVEGAEYISHAGPEPAQTSITVMGNIFKTLCVWPCLVALLCLKPPAPRILCAVSRFRRPQPVAIQITRARRRADRHPENQPGRDHSLPNIRVRSKAMAI